MRAYPALLLALLLTGCNAMTSSGDSAARAEDGPATLGALQGNGPRSPFEGREVSVHGIVTGNFVSGLDGFFIQDAAGADDGNPDTSDAVFVQWTRERTPKVRRGDRVRVSGDVVEIGDGEHSVTALTVRRLEVLGRGGVNVTLIEEAFSGEADLERFEGMWLRIRAPLTVTGNGSLARFGEIDVAFGGRLLQPTERHPPGPMAKALAADNRRRSLVLDDNRRGEYPDTLWIVGDTLDQDQPLRIGSVLGDVEGILSHGYGRWRLHLTREIEVAQQAPRAEPPTSPAGLRVASVNLENYFNGNGRGGGFPTPRGAVSRQEFERQTAKTVAMITALQPDVMAASELENDGSDARSAEAALLQALNTAMGEQGDYRAVAVPKDGSGDDQIRVALFYRESRVRPVGPAATLNSEPFAGGGSRPPLAQAFEPQAGGPRFVVATNHFKSKGGCAGPDEPVAPGDRDDGSLQGCWNATRVASAQALHDWLQTDPTGSGSQHVLLLGDLNANSEEDPLRLLRELGWSDALVLAQNPTAHTFVFAGQAGRIDHALLSPTLAPALTGAVVWHVNADEAEVFNYRLRPKQPQWYSAGPWRASDHDPLLIGLDFNRP